MTNLSQVLKSVRGPQGPGTVKSVLAGLAIAWGSRTAMRVAADATDRTVEATAYLATLQEAIKEAEGELSVDVSILRERAIDYIRHGGVDEVVKARAAALGWAEATPVPTESVTVFAPVDSGVYVDTTPGE